MDEVRGPSDPVLPWHHSKLNVLLSLAVAVVLGVGAGFFLGGSSSDTAHNDVDVGFLQDMRIHHEQAVAMSRIYLAAAPDGSPTLRTIASEIEIAQTFEAGRFVQLLRIFGAAETNETDVAMTWMGHSMPLEEMDGMATDAQLDELAAAEGRQADELFAALMIAHHEGGVGMAEHAAEHGKNREVTAMAAAMARAQAGEIAELERFLGR